MDVNLEQCAERVRHIYFVEPRRMEKATELYRGHGVKRVGNNLWHVASSAVVRHGHYTVNEEKLTCECMDFSRNNDAGTEGTFMCKHISAVLLARHIENETTRLNPPAEPKPEMSVNEIMQTLFGTPLRSESK